MESWVNLSYLSLPNYEVSSVGYIRNCKTLRVLQRKPRGRNPHVVLSLKKEDKTSIEIRIDEIVLRTFVGNPIFEFWDIVHIDNNPLNCNVINLKWVSREEKNIMKKEKYQDPYINLGISNEQWKCCLDAGYPDYMASSLGRIYSKLTGKILEGCDQRSGYITYNITDRTKFN